MENERSVVYYFIKGDLLYLLRFYENHLVIQQTTDYQSFEKIPEDLQWFHKNNSVIKNRGLFNFDGKNISFHTFNEDERFYVKFKGEINNSQDLVLTVYSEGNHRTFYETYKKFGSNALERNFQGTLVDDSKFSLSNFSRAAYWIVFGVVALIFMAREGFFAGVGVLVVGGLVISIIHKDF